MLAHLHPHLPSQIHCSAPLSHGCGSASSSTQGWLTGAFAIKAGSTVLPRLGTGPVSLSVTPSEGAPLALYLSCPWGQLSGLLPVATSWGGGRLHPLPILSHSRQVAGTVLQHFVLFVAYPRPCHTATSKLRACFPEYCRRYDCWASFPDFWKCQGMSRGGYHLHTYAFQWQAGGVSSPTLTPLRSVYLCPCHQGQLHWAP